jgi:DNA-binding beta-propeller fold protein YncE
LPAVPTPVRPSTGPVVVVANQDHGVATIVDLTEWRLVAHVDVGINPHEGAVSPDGRIVALTSPTTWMGDAKKVALLEVAAAKLVRSIDLGTFRWPHGVAFLDSRTLVVSSQARGGIVFIDTQSGALTGSAEAPGSQPYLLHLAPATGRVYTSSAHTNAISEFDLAKRSFLRDIHVPGQPAGFAVSPDGRSLWISTGAHDSPGTIVVVDAQSGVTRARLPVPGHARRLAFTGDGGRVVATDVTGRVVLIFDAANPREIGRIALGDGASPSGVACDRASPKCYVATIGNGELLEIDVAASRIIRRIEVGSGADGVVLVPRP